MEIIWTIQLIGFWILSYFIIMMTLSSDNINWITSSREWSKKTKVKNKIRYWTGPVRKYSWKRYIVYVLYYRIWTVWTDHRDRWPAIFSSVWMALIFMKQYSLGISGLIATLIGWAIYVKLSEVFASWKDI